MGLMNASQQFQQMIEDRLFTVRDVADTFIDDILVGTRVNPGDYPVEQHNADPRRVLEVLKEEKFVADVRECHFLLMK